MIRTTLMLLATVVLLAAGMAHGAVEAPARGTLLEFQVRDNLRLDSLDGATIAWRWIRTTDRAWRFGLSPTLAQSETGEIDRPYDRREERDSYGLELEALRLRYRPLQNRTRGYWGFGPVVGVQYTEARTTYSDSTITAQNTIKDIWRSWYLGGGIVIGAEVLVGPDLSLTAEYGALITLSGRSRSDSPGEARDFVFKSRSARLGLAVRF